jgi:ketosteroid isomerase-like protein
MGTAENRALVREYFARLASGDARLPELLADDLVWWIPPGSKLGGTLRGKPAVLELMGRAFSFFAPGEAPRIEIGRMIAEDAWVCVQFQIRARTAQGREYHNHYNLVFELRQGQIARVEEYVDTAYANERLIG